MKDTLEIVHSEINARDEEGNTPLHKAIMVGNFDEVRKLVQAGADINVPNDRGNTPLHVAVGIFSLEIAKYLIKNGANVNAANKQGITPLHVAADAVLTFGITGMLYRHESHFDMVKLLVESGADVNVKDDDGETPLHYACACENLEVVKYLVENGAKLNEQDHLGNTPLHYAVAADLCEGVKPEEIKGVIEFLLKRGADPYVKNKEGKSPMDVYPNNEIIKKFIARNALEKKQRSERRLMP